MHQDCSTHVRLRGCNQGRVVTLGGYQSGYGIIKWWIPDWIPPHQVHAGHLAKLDIGTARGGAATKRLAELINPLHL